MFSSVTVKKKKQQKTGKPTRTKKSVGPGYDQKTENVERKKIADLNKTIPMTFSHQG